jgi:hypothetical protein
MPAVQEGWKQYEQQAETEGSPVARIKDAQKNPQVIAALETLADMLGEEIFLYGGNDWVGSLDLLQQVIGTVRYGSMVADMTGQAQSPQEALAGPVLDLTVQNLDAIKVPTTMIGFKVEDTQRTKQQLDTLAGLLTFATMAVPQMANRFERTMVGESEFLTLTFDGEMVPWDEVDLEDLREFETNEGDADNVIAKLKALKLTVALGIRDNYLLLCFGESTDPIANLGKGDRLIDRPELKPVRDHADKRICGISYISDPMYDQLGSNEREIDSLLKLLDAALPNSGLSEEDQAQIRKDATALADDLKEVLPEPGAVTSFSFLTKKGIEGYTYNWAGSPWLDGSKPLNLLSHVGANPLLAVVWREPYQPEVYDMLVKWLEVGYGYFEKYAMPEMSSREREQFQKFMDLAGPLLERADKVNRDMLMPAMADSQGGLVLDGKLKLRTLCREAPDLEKPMPMIEPALVMGLTDAKLFRDALEEYFEIANDFIGVLHQTAPDDIPDFQIPEPEIKKTSDAEFFMYRLPKDWGVDRKVVPNLGISDDCAAWTVSRQHTERLLRETPLKVGGLLADTDRPLAVAVAFDWARLVDTATPWVELAAREIIKDQMRVDDDAFDQSDSQAATIMEQVNTVLDVLKVIRTCTVECYFEDEVLVSHSLMEIRDID